MPKEECINDYGKSSQECNDGVFEIERMFGKCVYETIKANITGIDQREMVSTVLICFHLSLRESKVGLWRKILEEEWVQLGINYPWSLNMYSHHSIFFCTICMSATCRQSSSRQSQLQFTFYKQLTCVSMFYMKQRHKLKHKHWHKCRASVENKTCLRCGFSFDTSYIFQPS